VRPLNRKKAIAYGIGAGVVLVGGYFAITFLKREAIGNIQWTDAQSFAVKLGDATGLAYQQEGWFGILDPQGWWVADNQCIQLVNAIPDKDMRDVQREFARKYGKSLPEVLVRGMTPENFAKIAYRFTGQGAIAPGAIKKESRQMTRGGKFNPL
jgi:hypothetical protein